MGARPAQDAGVSAATVSRMLSRHGVPSMTSRQPSHRIDTLSLTIVWIRTPRYSIAADGNEPPPGPSGRFVLSRSLLQSIGPLVRGPRQLGPTRIEALSLESGAPDAPIR